MAKFTQQQAEDAYAAIVEIHKIVEDSDPTKGCRCMEFVLNDNLYPIHLNEELAAMNATAQDVKDAFINELKNNVEYITPVIATTDTIENKV